MSKRALLIGVNEYAIPGANLRGCVNDVHNIAGALTELYGFAESDITMLARRRRDEGRDDAGHQRPRRHGGAGRRALPALLRPRLQRPRHQRRRGHRPPRRDPLPARPRLERPAHRRLAADDVRPARPRRVAHRRHGLLPLRQQHPRAARCRAPRARGASRASCPTPTTRPLAASFTGTPSRSVGVGPTRTSTTSTSPRPSSAAAATTRPRPTPTSTASTTAPSPTTSSAPCARTRRRRTARLHARTLAGLHGDYDQVPQLEGRAATLRPDLPLRLTG